MDIVVALEVELGDAGSSEFEIDSSATPCGIEFIPSLPFVPSFQDA